MRKLLSTEVLVVGGGASGVCAAIQAARLGRRVMLVEETPWLGGMLTSAGVSATDGNHHLPSGLWGEFRQKLYEYYGGPDQVKTGWVSHTLFEPKVGNLILQQMVKPYPNLEVIFGYWPIAVSKQGLKVTAVSFGNNTGEQLTIQATVTIEATECGDLLALAGISFSLGRESRDMTGESDAPETADALIQDLTYVAILRDYGAGRDRTIDCPPNFDPVKYRCTCRELCDDPQVEVVDAGKMLEYGRLPNHKYMINWPNNGNDYFLNLIEMTREERLKAYQKAKDFTLGWIYFIQTRGGFINFGLAEDEFPTPDHLPFIPYHRESRRVRGMVQLTVNDLVNPYADAKRPLYKTAIAVGDYPLDHHHAKSPRPVKEQFPKIPSFSIPYGALIPQLMDGMLVAEKSISVTHIVNGSTRLQPCVMLVGQAAGAAAALCCINDLEPRHLPVRQLQQALLDAQCWCLPYIELLPDNPFFQAVQRIGLSGVLKGEGISKAWANETRFYPEKEISGRDFYDALIHVYPPSKHLPVVEKLRGQKTILLDEFRPIMEAISLREQSLPKNIFKISLTPESIRNLLIKEKNVDIFNQDGVQANNPVSRKLMAYLLDQIFQPFQNLPVTIS